MDFLKCVLVILALLAVTAESKVFSKCELAEELHRNHFLPGRLENWVCLAEISSNFNTKLVNHYFMGLTYYGIFQIPNSLCARNKLCSDFCHKMVSSKTRALQSSTHCALILYLKFGFDKWPEWKTHCQNYELNCPFRNQQEEHSIGQLLSPVEFNR